MRDEKGENKKQKPYLGIGISDTYCKTAESELKIQ